MSRKPSSRDLRKLSAYLDGALRASAAKKLEKRLERDPNLRAALEELRQTRAILRRIPSRRAPRSFTLTPQMVAKRPPIPRLVPVMNYAAVFALLLLFVSFLPPIGLGAMAPAAEPEMMMEAPMAEEMSAAEEPMEEPAMEMEAEPAADAAEEPAEEAGENLAGTERAVTPPAQEAEEEGAQAEKTVAAATATIVPTATPTPTSLPTLVPQPPQVQPAPLLTFYQRVLIILLGVFVILSWVVRRVAVARWQRKSK